MAWGLFPILLASKGFYHCADRNGNGCLPCCVGHRAIVYRKNGRSFCKRICCLGNDLTGHCIACALLGQHLSSIYFTLCNIRMGHCNGISCFLATVAENTHPQDRAKTSAYSVSGEIWVMLSAQLLPA